MTSQKTVVVKAWQLLAGHTLSDYQTELPFSFTSVIPADIVLMLNIAFVSFERKWRVRPAWLKYELQ